MNGVAGVLLPNGVAEQTPLMLSMPRDSALLTQTLFQPSASASGVARSIRHTFLNPWAPISTGITKHFIWLYISRRTFYFLLPFLFIPPAPLLWFYTLGMSSMSAFGTPVLSSMDTSASGIQRAQAVCSHLPQCVGSMLPPFTGQRAHAGGCTQPACRCLLLSYELQPMTPVTPPPPATTIPVPHHQIWIFPTTSVSPFHLSECSPSL